MIHYLARMGLTSLLTLDRKSIASLIVGSADHYGGDSPRQFDDFMALLEGSNQEEVFWGLYSAFTVPRHEFRHSRQELAGSLLLRLRPPCPLTAYDAVRNALSGWEVSVEELPWYLALVCGEEAIWEALQTLDAEPLEEQQRYALNTFRFWLLPGWRDNPLARLRIGDGNA
jgi:hypothetical protein